MIEQRRLPDDADFVEILDDSLPQDFARATGRDESTFGSAEFLDLIRERVTELEGFRAVRAGGRELEDIIADRLIIRPEIEGVPDIGKAERITIVVADTESAAGSQIRVRKGCLWAIRIFCVNVPGIGIEENAWKIEWTNALN